MCILPNIRISVAQIDIEKKDKQSNLDKIANIANSIKGVSDILVLPETVTTGFGVNEYNNSEEVGGYSHKTISDIAVSNEIGIICSFFTNEKGVNYNRLYFFLPTGQVMMQDKRHLFSFGGENKYINSTSQRNIFEYKGWKILPTICYDIRFPVWCRNVNNQYDILINISNWPKARQNALDILLKARAIENMSYVISANRCGTDSSGLEYIGRSTIIDAKGRTLALATDGKESVITSELSLSLIHI